MGERLKHFQSEKEWKEQLEGFQKRGVARTWLLFMKNRVSWGDLFFLPMLNGPTHFYNQYEITSNDSVLNLASKEVIPLRSSLAVSPKGSVESRTDRVPEDCSEVELWGQQSVKAGSHGGGVHWRFFRRVGPRLNCSWASHCLLKRPTWFSKNLLRNKIQWAVKLFWL